MITLLACGILLGYGGGSPPRAVNSYEYLLKKLQPLETAVNLPYDAPPELIGMARCRDPRAIKYLRRVLTSMSVTDRFQSLVYLSIAGESAACRELVLSLRFEIAPVKPGVTLWALNNMFPVKSRGKDSDKDGLPDVLELKVGLNPLRRDTDGDGKPDAVDPAPTAAARPLGKVEKVLATAFEARFHFGPQDCYVERENLAACVILPEGVKPFEIPSWPGPMFFKEFKDTYQAQPLGQPASFDEITFSAPDPDEHPSGGKVQKGIWWSKDGKTAVVKITSVGGYHRSDEGKFTLRRFGPDWVVVRARIGHLGFP